MVEKTPTKRKIVSIYDHEADALNASSRMSRLYYEPAEEEISQVRKQADELGIKYNTRISDTKLQQKIDEHLNS